MRVALIWLNIGGPVGVSHGLLILARELVDAGHAVRVIHIREEGQATGDASALWAELADLAPDLVGLSFASTHAPVARRLAGELKEKLPATHLLCGGIHATLDPDRVVRWPGVDGVGLGELDGGHLVRYVDRLASGEIPTDQPGFWVCVGDTVHTNPMAPLPSLESQALPLFDGLDLDALVRAKRGFGEVLSGRGCPYRCRFCQNHALVARYGESLDGPPSSWPYVRRRGVGNLLAELLELGARAPSLRAIMFADDRFAADRAWLEELASRYPKEVGLPFIINATPEQIDPEVARLLFDAGCNMVKLGVECVPGELRRRVLGRPFGRERLEAAFSALRGVGINTMAYLMIGIPGQTAEHLLETFRFCSGLRPDAVRVSMFCPYPGTRLYDDLVASGELPPEAEPGDFLSGSVLRWPAAMELLLDKVMRIYPWLLNGSLGSARAEAEPLVDWVLLRDARTWASEETARKLRHMEAAALRRLRSQGCAHYSAPFPERPDYAFLRAPRRRPIINVDDGAVDDGAKEQEGGCG